MRNVLGSLTYIRLFVYTRYRVLRTGSLCRFFMNIFHVRVSHSQVGSVGLRSTKTPMCPRRETGRDGGKGKKRPNPTRGFDLIRVSSTPHGHSIHIMVRIRKIRGTPVQNRESTGT